MSYNIDTIDIIGGTGLFIARSALDAFNATADAPEAWEGDYGTMPCEAPGLLRFTTIPWHGEGSGRSLDSLIALLGQTYGSADLLLCWEGGDSYGGLRVINGIVTRHKIVMLLGDGEP